MTAARDFMIPLWSEDLGHMLEARVAVEEICSRCQRKRFLDLAAMAAFFNFVLLIGIDAPSGHAIPRTQNS